MTDKMLELADKIIDIQEDLPNEDDRNVLGMAAHFLRALPAQGEPVALVIERAIREFCRKSPGFPDLSLSAMAKDIADAVACPNSPVPDASPLVSGECEPVVKSASGAGEAIFAECAEIAMEHVGAGGRSPHSSLCGESYNDACQEISEAIRTRASNRKTMDALSDRSITE